MCKSKFQICVFEGKKTGILKIHFTSNSTEKLLVCGRIFIIVPNKIFEKDENVKNIENKMTKMRESNIYKLTKMRECIRMKLGKCV